MLLCVHSMDGKPAYLPKCMLEVEILNECREYHKAWKVFFCKSSFTCMVGKGGHQVQQEEEGEGGYKMRTMGAVISRPLTMKRKH